MRCVTLDSNGILVDISPQPATVEACAMVVPSGAEVVASPFVLSLSDASQIGLAIAGLWSLAFVLKLLRRQLADS